MSQTSPPFEYQRLRAIESVDYFIDKAGGRRQYAIEQLSDDDPTEEMWKVKTGLKDLFHSIGAHPHSTEARK